MLEGGRAAREERGKGKEEWGDIVQKERQWRRMRQRKVDGRKVKKDVRES